MSNWKRNLLRPGFRLISLEELRRSICTYGRSDNPLWLGNRIN